MMIANQIKFEDKSIRKPGISITENNAAIEKLRKIQEVMLPDINAVSEWIEDIFLIYQPKKTVGGDFYWWQRINNKIFIAVADATGHGLQGAFMAQIGLIHLQGIINNPQLNAMEILYRLNQQIISTLNQSKRDATLQDSIDLSICVIDLDHRKMQFSGAYRPLFIARNNQIKELRGDKVSVGGCNKYFEKIRRYSLHEFDIDSGDFFYMFSDGITDQFGGEFQKKYGKTRFKKQLEIISTLPAHTQKIIMEQKFNDWKSASTQIDDVLILGFKIF